MEGPAATSGDARNVADLCGPFKCSLSDIGILIVSSTILCRVYAILADFMRDDGFDEI